MSLTHSGSRDIHSVVVWIRELEFIPQLEFEEGSMEKFDPQSHRALAVEKLVALVKADQGKKVRLGSASDATGVTFTVTVPKNSGELASHAQDLASILTLVNT
jgi:hypothetical protein